MTDRFRDRLSEYRDGELASSEEALVRRHLEGCEECAQTLSDLEAVAVHAAELRDRTPERDLWAGIAARIENEHGSTVSTAIEGPAAVSRPVRRVTFTVPQLAAAAVALEGVL